MESSHKKAQNEPFFKKLLKNEDNATSLTSTSKTREEELKRYKVHSGGTDKGKKYEYKIAALLALRCVGLEVTNFWLASTVKDADAFDDLILHLEKPDGEEVTFMLQLKHKENPKNITKDEFSSVKGDFSLYKYYEEISNLHKSIHCNHAKKPKLVKNLGAFSNIYFILFSNRGSFDHKFLEKHSSSPLSFLNTNSDETVHKVDVTKVPGCKFSHDTILNCNLFLLSNQVSVKHLDDAIVEEIRKISCMLNLSNLNIQDVAKSFVLYTTEWAKGNLGGYYYLTKKDVLYQLTELFLNQYSLNIIAKPFLNDENDKLQIWNQVIANQPITVVDYSDPALKFLIQFVSTEVQKHCEGLVKNWTEQLSQEEQQLFYKNHSHLKEHILKHVGNHGRIRPLDIYKSLWRVNTLPLLLVVNDPSHFQNISKIVKFSNYSYKVIVLYKSLTLPCREVKQQHKENIKSFKTLKDLDKRVRNKILKQKVRLQGRPGAILKDIVTKETLQYITSKDILDILLGDFDIGNEIQEPVEYIIERTIFTKGVKTEILRNCNNEVFLILGKFEEILDILSLLGIYKIFDINDIDLNSSENIPGIINIHEDITSLQLEKFEKTKKPVHILSVYDSNYLEWIWSYGCRNTIEKYEVQVKYKVNQEHIARLLSTAAIISDVPGMGKSVLTNYIAYHAPVNKLILKVDLNAHQSYIRQHIAFSMDAFAHLRYFYETDCSKSGKNPELSRLIFEDFLNLNKIIILLDGFDEVAAAYKDEVTNMAESLYAEGFQVLITTRPVMKQHLEQTFKKTSFSIMPFTPEQRREYLTNFFTSANCDLKVPEPSKIQIFVEKLIQMLNENLNNRECEFMGNPLQTWLLANAFSSECTGTTDFNNKYDLLYLYHKFIENKINILIEKYAYEQHEEIREHQALLAIKLIFPLEQIMEADTLTKVYRFFTTKLKLIEILQREGIMIVDGKGNITCVHRTIAEFLAAQWLSDNLQNTNEEIKKFVHDLIIERFTRNYKFLFYIFDRILSQNCPLHLAIINKQVNLALNIINSESGSINVSDKGGRSALHTVALNGLQHSLPYQDYIYSKTDVMLRIAQKLLHPEIVLKSDILGYTPFDYALASCSLPIANELCTNTEARFINIYIDLQFKEDYLKYFIYTPYDKLLQIVLPYFASRDLLQNNVKKDTKLVTFYSDSKFRVTDYQNKIIIEILQSKYGKPYSGYIKKFSLEYYSDLRHAIACGSTSNAQQLLRHEETEINKSDMDNNTPLHYAVLHGRSEIVQLLLERKAKVNKQNKDLNTPLHLSLLNCDIKITEMLLSKEINLHNVNKHGETALHLAFSNTEDKISNKYFIERQSVIVNLLLSKGVDINSENNRGEIPFHYALKHGYPKNTINYLLSHGADTNKMSYDGQTPLHLAVMKGDTDIVEFLLMHGSHINAVNKTGNAPLHIAIQKGQQDNVKILIVHGANLNKKNANGYTPLILAVKEGRGEIIKFVVAKGADVNSRDAYGNTPLTLAAKEGRDEIIKFLVANGANINAQDADYYTPLILAVKEGRDEIIKFVVAKGADVNSRDAYGNTPLTLAAKEGRDEIIKILVANGADVNSRNEYGNTSLSWAAKKGRIEIVKFLVANGADVNSRDVYGNTPLNLAAKEGRDEIVKFLVANGANINAQDADYYTPLILAVKEGRDEIIKFVVAKGADVNSRDVYGNTPLSWAAKKGRDEIIKFLVANDADVNSRDAYDNTPLILAAKEGRDEIIKILVANGADVNSRNEYGNTSLSWAAKKGRIEIVKFLVANGADVNSRDVYGNTPLTLAAKEGRDEIVKFLVANEANINAQDADYYTPLILAAKEGREEIIKILVAKGADVNSRDVYVYYAIANRSLAVADKICEKLQDLPINIDVDNRSTYFMDCGKNKYKFLFTTLVKYFASREILIKHVSHTLESFVIDECKNAIFIMADGDPGIIETHATTMQTIQDYTSNLDKDTILDLFEYENGTYEDLRFAVSFGTSKNVESLLSTEKNINKQDADKNTALHYSVTYDNPECEIIIALLLSKGAEINKHGKHGNTALHYAIKNEKKEAVMILLKTAEVNENNDFGETPLHAVAKHGLTEIVKPLLEKNAEVNVKDDYGRTPLHYAADKNHVDILQLLLDAGAVLDEEDNAKITPLMYAARADHQDSVRLLLNKKADTRRKDFNGRNALHWAAYYNAEFIVLHLLKSGSEVNAADNAGNTALHYATRACNEILLVSLLIHKADRNALNNLKQTALHLACCRHNVMENEDDCNKFKPLQHEKVIKKLITKENVNMTDCYGNTPSDYANKTLNKIKHYLQENYPYDSENYVKDIKKCYEAIISVIANIKQQKAPKPVVFK